MHTRSRRLLKQGAYFLLFLFVLLNAIAAFHAWKFTHFASNAAVRTGDETNLSFGEKLNALFFGVSLPRPKSQRKPDVPYHEVWIQSNRRLNCWYIPADSGKQAGTVILFHGYGGSKSFMLEKAAIFRQFGYNTLLPDFMGAGESEGDQCTIGFKEAVEVRDCINYVSGLGERNIVLFGSSMGAAAIMKALNDNPAGVSKIIVECPYATMLRTVENRFRTMGVAPVLLPRLLVFWGGVENGFNAFSLKPETYARNIHCPTLLIWGRRDPKVAEDETDSIYKHLAGPKQLLKLPNAGHNDYLREYRAAWTDTVTAFLGKQL